MKRLASLVLAAIGSCVLLSCKDGAEPTARTGLSLSWAAPPEGGGEPEMFGSVYENGVRSTRTNITVTITPYDLETQSRLKGRWDGTMWANPRESGDSSHPRGWAYGWFDPRAANNCGTISQYEAGNDAGRAWEVHWSSAASPPDTSLPEGHCVRPGRYRLELMGAGAYRSFNFEYLGVRQSGATSALTVLDVARAESAAVEQHEYSTDNVVSDLVINVDLTTSATAPTPALRLQNVHSDAYADSFVTQAFPSGNENDWFRFSSHTSTGIVWNGNDRGRALALYQWDLGRPDAPPAFFIDDRAELPVLRVHQFSHVGESRKVYVALQIMQPNNLPDLGSLPMARDSIQFTRVTPPPPVACASFEATNTWRSVDQILNAACSTSGPSIQYRWLLTAGGTWTTYSPDTLYSFAGHSTSGSPTVWVQARNTSTGLASEPIPYPFSVSDSDFALDGRTYVTDKATNLYQNLDTLEIGKWYERFDHDTQWWPGTYEERWWMNRIWYAGDYSVSVRQQHWYPNSTLARGRLEITVCNPCGGDPAPPASPGISASSRALTEWSLFGGGPWLSWGSGNALRFYDLIGAHDVANRFTDRAWLDSDSGRATETGAGSLLTWRRRSTLDSNARVVDFTLAASPSPFTFGLALDPDLGPNAADDAAGFDGTRGMAYVWDGTRAVGFLLRDERGRNALIGVTQYGLQRHPPRSPQDTWTAQLTTQVRLLPGRSDVQLLLTAAERPGPVTWTFIMVRGASLAELQVRADAAIAQLTTR